MKFLAYLVLALSVAPQSAFASPDNVSGRTPQTVAADTAQKDFPGWRYLEQLTMIGPRMAGSKNERVAIEWAAQKMRDLGLQNVRIDNFPHSFWQRGFEEAYLTSPTQQRIEIVGLGRTVATPNGGIEAELAYVESHDALKKLPANALKGRIAFIDGPEFRPSRLGEDLGLSSHRLRFGASEAAKKGAVAVLVRSGLSGNARVAHAALLRYTDDAPQIPAAVVSLPDSRQIVRLVQAGQTIRVSLDLQPTRLDDATSGNVIGEIIGTEFPEEIILVGAHIDSWDLSPGAQDDAAGVAIMLAVMDQFSRMHARPKRTIRLVLFGAEEVSLGGARNYAERHVQENHVIGVEADYGAGAIWGFYTGVPEELVPAMDRIYEKLSLLGIERGHNRASGGEDLTFLKAQGMPVASLVQDVRQYFDVYHSSNDTIDHVDPVALRQNVLAFSVFIWEAANIDLTSPASNPTD